MDLYQNDILLMRNNSMFINIHYLPINLPLIFLNVLLKILPLILLPVIISFSISSISIAAPKFTFRLFLLSWPDNDYQKTWQHALNTGTRLHWSDIQQQSTRKLVIETPNMKNVSWANENMYNEAISMLHTYCCNSSKELENDQEVCQTRGVAGNEIWEGWV